MWLQNWQLKGSRFPPLRANWTHRETVGLWLKAIRIEGLSAFLDRYAEAKKGPRRGRQVPGTVKRLVWAIRLREHNCCGQKIQYFLVREQNIYLSVPKI